MKRVVLLGASNVTLAFPLIINQLRGLWDHPLEILAAHGHGRSYGRRSRVMFRELPGIVESGLWEAFDAADPAAAGTSALVTDVGNDLLYMSEVEQVMGWVEACLKRLSEQGAEITLTLPPIATISRLSSPHYYLMRSLLFPRCRVSSTEMRQRAEQLEQRLREVGEKYGARLIAPAESWYGIDPIHIRRRRRGQAWREILSAWSGQTAASRQPVAVPPVWKLRPQQRRIFGRNQTEPQPMWRDDGVALSLY